MTCGRRAPRRTRLLGAALVALALAGCTAAGRPRGDDRFGADPMRRPVPADGTPDALAPATTSPVPVPMPPAIDDITVTGTVNRPVVGGVRTTSGTYLVSADGGVFTLSRQARFAGSMSGRPLAEAVVAMTAETQGHGYWLVGADGGVFAFNRPFLGSTDQHALNRPVTAMAATPSGAGYWLVSADGGVFAFGDAVYLGGLAGHQLAAPIVAIGASPSGAGYWLVGADGGVFSYGDARHRGSAAGVALNGRVVGVLPTATGAGYWLAASDGGVFAFGDAVWKGSMHNLGRARVVGITAAPDGYRLVTDAGALLAPGDRPEPVRTAPDVAPRRTPPDISRSRPRASVPPVTVRPATAVAPSAPSAPSAPAVAGSAAEPVVPGVVTGEQVRSELNVARARSGLPALGWDGYLASFASSWSATMVTTGLHHRTLSSILSAPGGSAYAAVGETLYVGAGRSPSEVVGAWMASAAHRAQILKPSFTQVGVGVTTGGGRVWITADFGALATSRSRS